MLVYRKESNGSVHLNNMLHTFFIVFMMSSYSGSLGVKVYTSLGS